MWCWKIFCKHGVQIKALGVWNFPTSDLYWMILRSLFDLERIHKQLRHARNKQLQWKLLCKLYKQEKIALAILTHVLILILLLGQSKPVALILSFHIPLLFLLLPCDWLKHTPVSKNLHITKVIAITIACLADLWNINKRLFLVLQCVWNQ